MARPKHDKRRRVKITRNSEGTRYNNYTSEGEQRWRFNAALDRARLTHNTAEAAKRFKVPL